MRKIIEILKEKFPQSDFMIVRKDGKNIVLYNNEELEWDEEFNNFFYEKVNELFKEDGKRWISTYDYLDVINNGDQTGFYSDYNSTCVLEKDITIVNTSYKITVEKNSQEVSGEMLKKVKGMVLSKLDNKSTPVFVLDMGL